MSDEKAADDSSSTFSQAIHLLRLMLRLKLWKFLFWILLIPTLFLNFLIMQRLEKKNPDTVSGPSVKSLSAAEAANWKVLIARQAAIEAGTLKAIAQNRGVKSGSSWLTRCGETEACQIDFMESIVSLSDATRAFMKFERRVTEFYCLDGSRSDLICSYLFHLMHQSMDSGGATAASVFKDVNFIKLYDRFESETMKREWLKAKIDAPDSLCTRSAKNSGAFFDYFPRYFMLHLLVVASAMTLYFTVSTLSGVAGLKENGFLQLMFCNGLSVAAYWIVMWLITLAELLTMSALFVISYGIQCPGFFSPEGLFKSFLTLLCFFVLLASLGLLVTTIVGSYFVTLLVMIVFNVILAFCALVCRQQVASAAGRRGNHVAGAMVMLVFPPGNIVEYLLEAMLPKSPANRRPTGYEPYYQSIEVLLSVLPIIFIILTIYLDFVVKNGNGLCLPFMYPFNPSFWNPHRQKLIEMVDEQPKRANVEPTVGVPAVIADDIHLTYPSGCCEAKKPPVLKGITCTVYQGQITALIGHNGAGKTTLIRVLMGEEIPSRGVAVINGHRVTDPYQRLALRGSVSICKQVDVLSNYLTVMESMKLTLVAKGFSPDSQVAKVLDMMKRLGLAGKENVQAMDLSGGQMRKVCSIICLLGNPKLVILDEPTSGLDPVSRRNLWQILQDHKAGRSIILCTQFMDEADILADRKVFLSAGKIICAGSSMFLKNAFGCCVSINVSLKSVEFARPLVKCLKKVKLVSQMHTELLLNVSADKPQFLADAIQVLEEHKEWVEAFGVSQAQLDTIFMRLRHIDLENIEASFRSKKLRKVGRAERAEAAVVPFGICVFDSDKNDASATDLVTKECNAMFDVTEPEANQVKVIPKSPSVTMKDFLKQADVLQTIRKLCRISFCFILHSSSWNRNDSNRVREVHIGQYTVPPDVDIPNAAAISVGHMLTIYLKFSKHFKAVPRSNAPNLTIKRAYTFDTFESFEFTKSYELLMFITAFSIVPITYLNDPIEDRDCGVRQQLRSMGMRSLAYWLNNFILHWTHYMIYFLLSAAACMVWDRYQSQFFFVNVCLPVLIFGTASCLLSVYVVSALMKKSNPVVIVSCFFFALFLGVVANIAQNSSTAMLILICFLPQFTPVAYILLSVKLMIYSLYFLEVKNPDNVLNLANLHLSNSNILVSLIAMPVHCVLLVLLLILAENPAGIKLAFKKPDLEKGSELEKTIKDTGVPLEAERINKTPRNPLNMLEVRDLQKIYPNGVHAVRGTTFGSFSGEILGLLGPNGAGKTTSMSIIVGEEASSSGTSEVHFGGTWMSGIDGARCGAIGYCPQHNPLFNSISVFEHLRFYAQIRGIPDQLGSAQIAGLIEGLGLKPHQHKAAEQLSGGNKRRLCLAIALLGNPSLVVIDEASTGVDPENKRFIWGAIRGMANKQRSVMITTHSMEEVEALCARVGIMNKGLMIGFGTVQAAAQ
uniref:ABC transporter domain-containing protein n=1 Tax=Macrostomum lignano TaxID=282301 RepID=A0A1I8GC67_9PLAT